MLLIYATNERSRPPAAAEQQTIPETEVTAGLDRCTARSVSGHVVSARNEGDKSANLSYR